MPFTKGNQIAKGNLPNKTSFRKGLIPWNKGLHVFNGGGVKKGNIPWNKGLKTGLIPKTAFQKGLTPWNKGKAYPSPWLNKHYKHLQKTRHNILLHQNVLN